MRMVDIPFWPFKKKKKRMLSRDRFLESRPLVNPMIKIEETEPGIVTLLVPIDRKGIPAILSKSVTIPDHKKIQLDEIGSKVWGKMDGKASMSDISRWMVEEFKITPREAELSLSAFFDKLSSKGLVGLMVPPPKPGTEEAKEEAKELRARYKEIQELHRKGKMTSEQLVEAEHDIEERLKIMGEPAASGESA